MNIFSSVCTEERVYSLINRASSKYIAKSGINHVLHCTCLDKIDGCHMLTDKINVNFYEFYIFYIFCLKLRNDHSCFSLLSVKAF